MTDFAEDEDLAVTQVVSDVPRVLLACQARVVRDPETGSPVSMHQARILRELHPARPMRLTELAGRLGVTVSTMSLAVDRLVQAGFVVRDRDPGDRRAVALRLSEAGERVSAANPLLDADRVRSVLSHLSERERKQVLSGLNLLARAASATLQEHTANANGNGSH